MKDQTNRNLKNILILPKFQLKLLSYFIGLFFLTTASLYSAISLFFWSFEQKALKVGIPQDHVFFSFLNNQKGDMDFLFIGLVFFNLILLITIGFLISHRLAGPYLKIKNHLEEFSSDSQDLKLRESDFFKDLEPTINKLREKLK